MAAATTTSLSTTTITDQGSISLFNRGPITSTFTPPTSCLSTLTSTSGGNMYFGHWGTGYYDPACFPSSTTDAGESAWAVYYFNPAQCPLGWSHALTITNTFSGYSQIALTLGTATTAVLCCPSGYSYGSYDHQCQSAFASTTSTLLYILPTLNGDNQYTTAGTLSTLTVAVPTGGYTIFGDGIPVWWQSSDLKAFTASPTSATTTQPSITTQPSTTATTSGTTSPTPLPGPSPGGLSTGAKIGIGLGIPVAVIAISLFAFCFYFRRRRLQIAQAETQETAMSGMHKRPDLGGELSNGGVVSELYSNNELYDPYYPRAHHELPED